MSKDWMLTPKEEAEAWNVGYGRISRVNPVKALVPREVSEHVQEAIAEIKKAQARKLVEDIQKHGEWRIQLVGEDRYPVFVITDVYWQNLLKEVGLEEK